MITRRQSTYHAREPVQTNRATSLRQALAARKITACIPSKVNRKVPIPHDAALYRRRHKIEIMFGRLKDRRRIHTRYDRCAHTFMSAIALAALVIFWL
jgi:transposase